MTSSKPWLMGGATMVIAATVVATVFAAADATAQSGSGGHPSVTVDLSVIEGQVPGPTPGALARQRGLRMPTPGVYPQSQLHEPNPSSLPYATLTPPRQRPVNLRPPGSRRPSPTIRALALTNPSPPPRPQEASPPSSDALTSIGKEPRAVTAPSRHGAVVGPTPSLPQTLGPADDDPAPLSPQPGDDATAVAATDPDTVSVPASDGVTPAPPPLPAADETASATESIPEPTETRTATADSASVPQPEQATATANSGSVPQPQKEAAAPAPQAEEKTVALEPASHGEQATLPPPEQSPASLELVQVEFDATETDLSDSSRSDLQDLANRLRSQESLRLQLLAYAEGAGLSPSKARRMSLSRALSVRSYLIENGIKTSRIDVRALGNKAPSAPMDRVDVKVVQR